MIIAKQTRGQKEEQEDAYFYAKKYGITFAVVADGLSNMLGGAIASLAICDEARLLLESELPNLENAEDYLKKFVENAQNAVCKRAQFTKTNPHSTFAALLILENKAFLAHAGDSRIYKINSGKIIFKTEDHSLIQKMHNHGKITEAQMSKHPLQHEIYSCIGQGYGEEIEYAKLEINENDWFLLCTDGLWTNTKSEELCAINPKDELSINLMLRKAKKNAKEAKANITLIVIS